MKRILIFSLAYYPRHVGGAEVAIHKITDRVDNVEFHLITNRFDGELAKEEKIGNVFVHRIGITRPHPSMKDLKAFPLSLNKPLFQFYAAFYALFLHRKWGFDGIWAMMAHSCGVPAAIFKLFHPEVPYLLTLQEGDPTDYVERKMRPLWPLFARAFSSADYAQAISTYLGAWALARGFKGTLRVIPNGVDSSRFSRDIPDDELEPVRDAIGKREGEIWMIHTGRFVAKNGLEDAVSALKFLPAHVHLFLIGEGTEREAYEKIAERDRTALRLHFHPYVHVDEIPKFLKACDVFVRPSRSEGMGNSFVEAMAARLPVIATQVGGLADFLFDEKRDPGHMPTGWAVDAGNPQQIASALQDISAHIYKTQGVLDNAQRMVAERYDWDLIARDMLDEIFDPMLGPETKKRPV